MLTDEIVKGYSSHGWEKARLEKSRKRREAAARRWKPETRNRSQTRGNPKSEARNPNHGIHGIHGKNAKPEILTANGREWTRMDAKALKGREQTKCQTRNPKLEIQTINAKTKNA